jgi:hypothetical protein
MRRPLLLAATAAVLAACSATNNTTSGSGGVATNPPNLPGGGALHGVTPSAGTSPGVQTTGIRTVLAPLGLNVRATPLEGSQLVATVPQGTVLTVIGYNPEGSGWYQVKSDSGSGWITDNPLYSSPHRFTVYQSVQRGFSALYLEDWTFSENPGSVVFRPQSGGGQAIVVLTGAKVDDLGAPGRDGYTLLRTEIAEVYGVTASLRIFSRTGTVASPGPDSPPPLQHLAELRFTIDSSRAMRLDFGYNDQALLPQFSDFFSSVAFPAPATPGASGSPGASPAATAAASPTPL